MTVDGTPVNRDLQSHSTNSRLNFRNVRARLG